MLYNESDQNFDWKEFKKQALEKEDGEDFQSRMANIDVRSLPEAQYDEIRKIKDDPEFNKLCDDPRYVSKLIDLGDWMEYVCAAVDFQNKKLYTQHEYDKINKEMQRKNVDVKTST